VFGEKKSTSREQTRVFWEPTWEYSPNDTSLRNLREKKAWQETREFVGNQGSFFPKPYRTPRKVETGVEKDYHG